MTMIIVNKRINFHKAKFYQSVNAYCQWPIDQGLEVAFSGRSNVGKSTLINVLTQQKKLAYTSKTPGRTQLINFFTLSDQCRLVDLPGYGYAKVSRQQQQKWQQLVSDYLHHRKSLTGLILLIDSRHINQHSDQQMIEWAIHSHVPLHIVLTKVDKLSRQTSLKTLRHFKKVMTTSYHAVSPISLQLFSSTTQQGLDELKQRVSTFLNESKI